MRWWNANQPKDDAAFERELLEARSGRLVRLQNRVERGLAEQRLLLEEVYQTAPEKNKETVLLRYLRSSEPDVRALGATLVQGDFKQTRPVTPAVREQLRAMVSDSSAQVRIAVAQALFLLNDAQAFDALLAQLAREPDADVRMELARALVPMRDVRVVDPLLALLKDPSIAVAAEAARGLASDNLAPLIQKDPNLATRAAVALRQALDRATGAGTTDFRAAVVDAMGALKNDNLDKDFGNLLRPDEPVPVRRAALRALGQLGKPNGQAGPAEMIVQNSLHDPDDTVRQEAVRALRGTADFSHAEALYELTRPGTTEKSPAVRDEAWGVLRNLFADPTATNNQLSTYADRFKADPDRRIEVLRVLAERLTPLNDAASQSQLASVRMNLGAEYMTLAGRAAQRTDLDAAAKQQAVIDNAKQADIYFDLALKYYRAKDPRDEQMTTSDLIERRINALLTSKQYGPAADFAAGSIGANPANQEAMGRAIRGELDRLNKAGAFDDALRLIDAVKKMNPPLADTSTRIQTIEAEIRKRVESQPSPTGAPTVLTGQ
jgi:HEAT repeat protein